MGFQFGQVLVTGTISDRTVQAGKSRRTGEDYRIVRHYVASRRDGIVLSFPREWENKVLAGATGTFEVQAVYRDYDRRVEYDVLEVCELVDADGEVLVDASPERADLQAL